MPVWRGNHPMKTRLVGFGSAMAVALIAVGSQRSDDPGAPAATRARGDAQAEKKAESGAGLAGQRQDSSPEEKAVRELVDAFVKAYNAKDAKAIATQFAEDGRIVGPDGSITEGREAIERRYRAAFDD